VKYLEKILLWEFEKLCSHSLNEKARRHLQENSAVLF
jgi:hypothetical protein